MDPATICCPHLDCPARGPAGQGNLGSHSRQDQRFRCRQCCTTCTATQGPACSRRHTPVERMTLVITLLAHGCPLQAIVVAVSGLKQYFDFYNRQRLHQALAYQTPASVYFGG